MEHRHIDFKGLYTPDVVDDVISRGDLSDWAKMGKNALTDKYTRDSIRRITEHFKKDPYAQRHAAWRLILKRMEEEFKIYDE